MMPHPLLMFLPSGSPGALELLVVFAVTLMLFGPRKLPGIARTLGRMLGQWRKASEDFRTKLMSLDESGGRDPAGDRVSPPYEPDQADIPRKHSLTETVSQTPTKTRSS